MKVIDIDGMTIIGRPERLGVLASAIVIIAVACGSATPVGSTPGTAVPSSQAAPTARTAATTPVGYSPAAKPPASASALSAPVIARIPLAGFPGGPTVGSHAVWYWDGDRGKVFRVDTTSNQVVATISPGDPGGTPYGSPKTIAANGQVVWMTDALHHAVDRIDPATNTVVERLALDKVASPAVTGPVDPFGIAFDGSALWVSDFDQGIVLRVDTKSGKVTTVVSGIDHPEGLAVGFGSLWVVEHRKAALARIDLASATVRSIITLPGTGTNGVCGMCVDNVVSSPDGVWVPLDFGNEVVRIDPTTNTVNAQIPFDRVVDSLAVGDGAVWIAGWDGSIPCTDVGAYVARIDVVSNAITDTQVVPCALGVAVADGDVWVGTADAPNGVTRLRLRP